MSLTGVSPSAPLRKRVLLVDEDRQLGDRETRRRQGPAPTSLGTTPLPPPLSFGPAVLFATMALLFTVAAYWQRRCWQSRQALEPVGAVPPSRAATSDTGAMKYSTDSRLTTHSARVPTRYGSGLQWHSRLFPWHYRVRWTGCRPCPSELNDGCYLAAVGLGAISMGYYYSWWLEPARGFNLLLGPLLVLAVLYNLAQVFGAWYIYTRVAQPQPRRAPAGLRVDVFIPVYDEDATLVERSLTAAVAIRYPHRTFLLDDAQRDAYRELAEKLGVMYIRRDSHEHAKAGNVNHALQYSDADFVTVFDVDHIPEPHFLDVVLGHFDDREVGFVQAFVAHGNQSQSFVANAVAAQAYDVFSPTSMGMNGCGAATVWGAHCTFRRAALDSIGGHQVGLAEDLHTSLVLHSNGWKSVYVPQVVARGLVPADLGRTSIQQLKWSRGVFEILMEKSFDHLQRLRFGAGGVLRDTHDLLPGGSVHPDQHHRHRGHVVLRSHLCRGAHGQLRRAFPTLSGHDHGGPTVSGVVLGARPDGGTLPLSGPGTGDGHVAGLHPVTGVRRTAGATATHGHTQAGPRRQIPTTGRTAGGRRGGLAERGRPGERVRGWTWTA